MTTDHSDRTLLTIDSVPTEIALLAKDLPTGFRRDIEGLRALAVLVVLLYHAHLGPFKGGFLGVDVFFVLSGYLITALLMKDIWARGPRALPRFWGRRFRRLLPASLTVVIVTLIAARLLLDPLKQADLGHDAWWASFFVVNIRFAFGDSYAALQTTPTPLLHFWSLAVEEQFYIVWPLLLFALTRVRRYVRWYALAIMAAFFLESLLAFVWFSPWAHTQSFFLLPTRAWELIAGAMLTLAGRAVRRIPLPARAAMGWIGLLAIFYSVFSYNDTANLGYAALLPVLGTVAVVAARGPGRLYEPGTWLGMRPMVWVGRRSYGIYLWHWPMLVLLDAKYGPLSAPVRLLVLIAATGAAALSFHYIENPVRESKWLAVRPSRSLAMGFSLVAVGALAAVIMINLPRDVSGGEAVAAPTLPGGVATTISPSDNSAQTSVDGSTLTSTLTTSTVGGTTTTAAPPPPLVPMDQLLSAQLGALDAGAQITKVPKNATPPVASAKADKPHIYRDKCVLANGTTEAGLCQYGDLESSTLVVLFGDSHAAQWFPALEQLALSYHWKLEVMVKSGCPTADVRIRLRYLDPECVAWRAAVATRLAADHPDLIVMSSTAYDPGGSDVGVPSDTAWRRGLEATLGVIRPLTTELLIIGDTPLPAHEIPNCLAAFPHNVQHCMAEKSKAVNTSRIQLENELAAGHDASFVDVSDWVCGTSKCPVIIGNIVMYRDNNHLSATMSEYLAPFVAAVVVPILPT